MYSPSSPEQLEKKGISPELFEAAQDYALVVSEQNITYPVNVRAVDKFNKVLNQFVAKCVEASASDSDDEDADKSLQWVSLARECLRQCGRSNPRLSDIHKTRLFGPSCTDHQRQLYKDAVSDHQAK